MHATYKNTTHECLLWAKLNASITVKRLEFKKLPYVILHEAISFNLVVVIFEWIITKMTI